MPTENGFLVPLDRVVAAKRGRLGFEPGKNLPVWRSLPHLAYWLLLSALGLPLVARALDCYRGAG